MASVSHIVLPKAYISEDMKVDNTFMEKNLSINPQFEIEAFFIPTLGRKNNIELLIKCLLDYKKPVYVIGSQDTVSRSIYEKTNFTCISNELHYRFLTSLESSQNPSSIYKSDYDLPTKRNVALEIARKKGYKYVVLIDDDILPTNINFLKSSSLFERGATIVGYYSLEFPDKSTVSLIESALTQRAPGVCLSGNCLAINMDKITGFFPYVYNEDWLFIMNNMTQGDIYGAGIVSQCDHKPWLDFERIRFEQFGDVIAYTARNLKIAKGIYLPENREFWIEAIERNHLRLQNIKEHALSQGYFIDQINEAITTAHQFSADQFTNFIKSLYGEINDRKYENIFN